MKTLALASVFVSAAFAQPKFTLVAHSGAGEATIRVMEDSGLYDARRGAYYNKEGIPEMDASIMGGRTLQAGAAASLKHIANPIHLARLVMEKTSSGHGTVGVVALDRQGHVATPFNTDGMMNGLVRSDGKIKIAGIPVR